MNALTWCLVAVALLLADAPRPTASMGILSAVFGGVFAILVLGKPSVVIALAMVGATATWALRSFLQTAKHTRLRRIHAAYLGTLAADLRAGASLPHALSVAAQQLPAHVDDKVRRPLHTAGVVAARGGNVAPSLRACGLEQLAALIELADVHGLPLAGLVEQAQSRLDAAHRHAQATAASLQGPQSTAAVLSLLPLLGVGMGAVMGAQPLTFLSGGGIGALLLVVGCALMCAGFVWAQLIIGKAKAC